VIADSRENDCEFFHGEIPPIVQLNISTRILDISIDVF
jgi:hypothetical protein